MTITTNGKTFKLSCDNHGWTLHSPVVKTDKKTKEKTAGFRPTYYPTVGQCLAAIADRVLGDAKDITDMMEIANTLRQDLFSFKPA